MYICDLVLSGTDKRSCTSLFVLFFFSLLPVVIELRFFSLRPNSEFPIEVSAFARVGEMRIGEGRAPAPTLLGNGDGEKKETYPPENEKETLYEVATFRDDRGPPVDGAGLSQKTFPTNPL